MSADLGSFERFAKPALPSLLSGLLGIVPSEYTSEWLGVVGGESGAIGRASVW